MRVQSNMFIAAILAASAIMGFASPGWAQNEARISLGMETWKTAGCTDCHGPFADGDKQREESPSGPSLRERTHHSVDTLKTVISCGRPGSDMPAFEDGAYTIRQCYGRALGDAPGNMYPAPARLTADQIDALANYLLVRVIGRGPITKAECLAFHDEAQKSLCDNFK
jgi:mono/diheme cytochrome c family protein